MRELTRWPAAALTLMFAASACGGPGFKSLPTDQRPMASQTSPARRINHIIIIFQENRTFDNLMQGVRGADLATSGLNSKGQSIPLHPQPLEAPPDLNHEHSGFVTEYDGGKMDGFDQNLNSCVGENNKLTCAYAYVPQSETQPLLDLCAQYTCADRMFQSNQGPSLPAHQYIIGASASAAGNPTHPRLTHDVSSNLLGGQCGLGPCGGCDAKPGSLVNTINDLGVEGNPVFPCFDHRVLADELDAAQITWKFYQNRRGAGLWNSFDYIAHIRYGPDYANVTTPSSKILDDVANGELPQVSWVVPSGANSDHAGSLSNTGPSWVASIVNAVGTSQYWRDTAIFITWDDWGGWYDHVRPQSYDSYELGFRVPLIVVSPYANRAYVSHVQHEFGSILHFVEEAFGLASLKQTDQRADDLMDCFNFAPLHARRFNSIRAPYPASHFLHQGPDAPGEDGD